MKRKTLLILLLLLAIPLSAYAAYWENRTDLPVVCCEDNPACQILQMVMMGSFDFFDPGDQLSGRVLSAALDSLCLVTDDDFSHFTAMFDVEESVIRRYYYIALGNCLWADIVTGSHPISDAKHVLLLFLDPSSEADAHAQISEIRIRMNDDLIAELAQAAGVPEDFVYYLVYSENWHKPDVNM